MTSEQISRLPSNQFCINLDLECIRHLKEESEFQDEEDENIDGFKTAPHKGD